MAPSAHVLDIRHITARAMKLVVLSCVSHATALLTPLGSQVLLPAASKTDLLIEGLLAEKVLVGESWIEAPKNASEVTLAELEPVSSSEIGLDESITMITGSELRAEFKKCAIVGSSGILLEQTLGDAIDAHDTVVRVNRLPVANLTAHVGSKTSILYGNIVSDRVSLLQKAYYKAESFTNVPDPLHHDRLQCPYIYDNATNPCNFDNLVLNSGMLDIGVRWRDVFPEDAPGFRPDKSVFPIGHQSLKAMDAVRVLEEFVFQYGKKGRKRGTSGLHALFTFGPLCEEVDMYGFGGSHKYSVDAHKSNGKWHNYDVEHSFMDNLAGHPDNPACEWLREDCGVGSSPTPAQKAGCVMLKKLGCRLSDMARNGRLRFAGSLRA